MKPESGINNRWELLDRAVGVDGLRRRFNAYSWYNDDDLKISKDEHWCGFWNDCFDFVTVWPKTSAGMTIVRRIVEAFTDNGYTVESCVNNGVSIRYETMTAQESHDKARRNLLSGGRCSD